MLANEEYARNNENNPLPTTQIPITLTPQKSKKDTPFSKSSSTPTTTPFTTTTTSQTSNTGLEMQYTYEHQTIMVFLHFLPYAVLIVTIAMCLRMNISRLFLQHTRGLAKLLLRLYMILHLQKTRSELLFECIVGSM